MYVCLDCGCGFYEPHHYTDVIGEYHGEPAEQTFYVCPFCGGDFEEEKTDE